MEWRQEGWQIEADVGVGQQDHRRRQVGERVMEQVMQVELRTDATHTLTWLDVALKPKPGMVLVCKGDPRPWTVVHAYAITAHEMKDNNIGWKVGGL